VLARHSTWLLLALLVSISLNYDLESQNLPQARPLSIADVYKRVRESVVLIQVGESIGAGVFVTTDGYMLTAMHVLGRRSTSDIVKNPEEIQVHWIFGSCVPGSLPRWHSCKIPVTVEMLDPEADLALLKIRKTESWKGSRDYPALKVKLNYSPEVGESIGILGFPLHGFEIVEGQLVITNTTEMMFLTGVVSTPRPVMRSDLSAALSFFWTDASVAPGFSGGPVFRLLDGDLIGILIQKNPVGMSYGLASAISNIRGLQQLLERK